MDFLSGLMGSGIGATLVGSVFMFFLKRFFARQDKVEARLERLETERITRIEKGQTELARRLEKDRADLRGRLEAHVEADNPGRTDVQISALQGEMRHLRDEYQSDRRELNSKLAEIAAGLGRLAGTVESMNNYLNTQNKSLQIHLSDREAHNHGR